LKPIVLIAALATLSASRAWAEDVARPESAEVSEVVITASTLDLIGKATTSWKAP
jgi:hypothetical protein